MSTRGIGEQHKANYDAYYDGGREDRWREAGAAAKVANILSVCASVPHASVLEIGAGQGAVLAGLSRAGFAERLAAVEVSASGVAAIRARGISELSECRLYDGATLPFDEDAFDLVVLTHVVEHLEHPRQVLAEAGRVGRHVFVEVPCEDTLTLSRDYRPDGVGHINTYSPRSIRRLLQTCGFDVVTESVRNMPRAAYDILDPRFGRIKHAIKSAALRVAPRLATSLWTYHAALLGRLSDADVVAAGSPGARAA